MANSLGNLKKNLGVLIYYKNSVQKSCVVFKMGAAAQLEVHQRSLGDLKKF